MTFFQQVVVEMFPDNPGEQADRVDNGFRSYVQNNKGQGRKEQLTQLIRIRSPRLTFTEPISDHFTPCDILMTIEKKIKGWSRKKKEALINKNWDDLVKFSKNYTEYGKPNTSSTGSD